MARKGNSQRKDEGHVSPNTRQRVAFKGYINYTPTAIDKAGLRAELAAGNRPSDRLADFILSGLRFGCSFDAYHSAFSATFYDTNLDSPSAGYTLVARADTVWSAIERLCYLHAHVFSGDWSTALSPETRTDEWGD